VRSLAADLAPLIRVNAVSAGPIRTRIREHYAEETGSDVARLDEDERRSQQRRLYLYAAILGGVLGLLVFGSAGLYRLLNAALAFSFTRDTWHDVWHFAVDSAVAGSVAWWNFRTLRADRAALGAAAEETYAITVLVPASDREAARARVARALAGDAELSVKG